jgi:hypothetical protein
MRQRLCPGVERGVKGLAEHHATPAARGLAARRVGKDSRKEASTERWRNHYGFVMTARETSGMADWCTSIDDGDPLRLKRHGAAVSHRLAVQSARLIAGIEGVDLHRRDASLVSGAEAIQEALKVCCLTASTTNNIERSTMNAKAIRYHRYGPPEVMALESIEEPALAPGQVRVSLRAAGVAPVDTKLRAGLLQGAWSCRCRRSRAVMARA